jgi:hypothetical protein
MSSIGHRDTPCGAAQWLRQLDRLVLRHGLHHLREHVGHGGGRDDRFVSHRHQEIVVEGIDEIQLRAAPGRLPHPVRDERMVLPQRAADNQQSIELVDLRNLHPEPRHTGTPVVITEIGLAQPEIHVTRGKLASEFS